MFNNQTTAPAQVLHMRRERTHLTSDQQCARCGEAAVITPDGTVTESCIWHHEDDARAELHDLRQRIAELDRITREAGHLIDAALLDQIEAVAR